MEIVLKFKDEWVEEYGAKNRLIPAWIYLQHEGKCYPDDDWIDNPTVLLGWWLHSVSDLLKGGEGQGISFMEGPFFVAAALKGEDFILESEDSEISWVVNKLDMAKELMKVANQAARKLHDTGLTELSENLNGGIKELKTVVKKLSKG